MSLTFVVITEARADFITATELADRVLLAEVEWLDDQMLLSQREWVGEDGPGYHLAWSTISHRARELGIKVHGHFNNEAGLPDARAARRAIRYVLKRFGSVDAIVLIRDLDDQHERKKGLDQARDTDTSGKKIIVGVANCERECWVISGFDPESDDERQLLGSEHQKLGANPSLRSHELNTCKSDIALRSPKRVLKLLTGDSWERQCRCWRATPLKVLIERGEDNGLADYLKEVKDHLCPLISGHEGKQ